MTSQIDTKAASLPIHHVGNSTNNGELQNGKSLLLHLLLNLLLERGWSRQEQGLHPRMHSKSNRSMLAACSQLVAYSNKSSAHTCCSSAGRLTCSLCIVRLSILEVGPMYVSGPAAGVDMPSPGSGAGARGASEGGRSSFSSSIVDRNQIGWPSHFFDPSTAVSVTYEAYKHTPGTFQSLREVKIDVQKCIGTMTMSLNAVLGRFLGIHDRGDRPVLQRAG